VRPETGSWLGDAKMWPPHDVGFELSFELPKGYAAPSLSLAYSVEGVLRSATLNGVPLYNGGESSSSSTSIGGPMVLQEYTDQPTAIMTGTNRLHVTVGGYGAQPGPRGWYCKGSFKLERLSGGKNKVAPAPAENVASSMGAGIHTGSSTGMFTNFK